MRKHIFILNKKIARKLSGKGERSVGGVNNQQLRWVLIVDPKNCFADIIHIAEYRCSGDGENP